MSIEKIMTILDKQQLVGKMLKKQNMQNHDRIESVVLKQQNAELQNYLSGLSSGEIANSLESMSPEQAQCVWASVPPHRQNEILWEMSSDMRNQLASGREPEFTSSKVSVFELADGKLKEVLIQDRKDLEKVKPIWIDLVKTTKAERAFIGAHFAIDLPNPLDETELEVSSRFYIESDDAIHLHSNFLLDRQG